MPTRFNQEEGIVLAVARHTEANLRVIVFSKTTGKIALFAKGARSLTSRRLSSLQPGYQISLSYVRKDTVFGLTESRIVKPICLQNKLGQYVFLFFLCEIMVHLLPWEEVNSEAYLLCQKALLAIEKGSLATFITLEIQLIRHLGFSVPNAIILACTNGQHKKAQLLLKNLLEEITEKTINSFAFFKPHDPNRPNS